MQALEIGHLGGVARLDQGLEAVLDQLGQAAAQHHLLAEQVGFAFLAEAGLDDARTAAADGRGIGQGQFQGIARGVLGHRHQTGDAAALQVFAAHGVAGALGGDHEHVEIGAGLDQLEVDVEAMGEDQGGALLQVGGQIGVVQLGLQLVGGEDHHHVAPLGGLGRGQDLEALGLGLLGGGRAGAQRDGHVLDAGIAQVQRMGVTLAAIADHDDLLALDQIDVGIPIVIDAHLSSFREAGGGPAQKSGRLFKSDWGRAQWRRRRCAKHRTGRAVPSA